MSPATPTTPRPSTRRVSSEDARSRQRPGLGFRLRRHARTEPRPARYAPPRREAAHQLITDIELNAANSTEPFPDVRTLASTLRASGRKTAVVTRNCSAAVHTIFPDVGDVFDIVLARDDVEYLKPDSRHITLALDELSVSPQTAAMIGDGGIDMRTAKSLGMYCVGVLTGSGDTNALLDAGADVIVPHVGHLVELDWS